MIFYYGFIYPGTIMGRSDALHAHTRAKLAYPWSLVVKKMAKNLKLI